MTQIITSTSTSTLLPTPTTAPTKPTKGKAINRTVNNQFSNQERLDQKSSYNKNLAWTKLCCWVCVFYFLRGWRVNPESSRRAVLMNSYLKVVNQFDTPSTGWRKIEKDPISA